MRAEPLPGGVAQPFRINSAVPGIAWPALPAANGAALLSTLFQLEQSQWWTAEDILGAQRDQLAELLLHARDNVPFYRERLGPVPDLRRGDDWLTAWRTIPILERTDIQDAAGDESMTAEKLPAGHGELREIFTSGSTGTPIRSVRTQLWELMWSAFTIRDHLWHRRDFRGTFAALRESGSGKATYPEGAMAQSWGYSSATVVRTGPMVSLNVGTPVEAQVEWLQRKAPEYLLTHPSIALRLAQYCLEHGKTLPNLRQVITISENLKCGVRAAVRNAWNVPVVDIYSTREIGYIALQCPDHEHYHVQSEHVFLEVLDENGSPCKPGETGKAVLTALHNLGMPLIRYDIGDYVELGEPCPCGRGLPVIKRVLGRTQNMLVMPSGERRWPLLSSGNIEELMALAPIRQYQFIQRSLDQIELRLALLGPLDEGHENALTRWTQTKFGYPFRVTVTVFDEIPRTGAGKFEDFLSDV